LKDTRDGYDNGEDWELSQSLKSQTLRHLFCVKLNEGHGVE